METNDQVDEGEFDGINLPGLLTLRFFFDLGDAGVTQENFAREFGPIGAEAQKAFSAGCDLRAMRTGGAKVLAPGYAEHYQRVLDESIDILRNGSPKGPQPVPLREGETVRVSVPANVVFSVAWDGSRDGLDAKGVASEMLNRCMDELGGISPRFMGDPRAGERIYPRGTAAFEAGQVDVEDIETVEDESQG